MKRDVTGRPIPFYASPYYRRLTGERCRSCVYALFVDPGEGPGYIKIGITENLLSRLDALQVGCPLPIEMIALIDAGHYANTPWDLEEAFHKRFAHRRTSGEWFRFDFNEDADKAEFNEGSREVLRAYFGEDHPWWVKETWSKLRKRIRAIQSTPTAAVFPRVVGEK